MNIVIVGCGKVGYTIAKNLSEEEDNNIIIIDKKIDAFGSIMQLVDALVIKGNCLSAKTLQEANIKMTDLIICVTNSDETNILCCLTAKKLGAKQTIARIRDPEYALELTNFKKDLGLDMIINPEQQAALEISHLLRFPSANDIDTFVGGRMELVSFKLNEGSFICGKTLLKAFANLKFAIIIVLIERGQEAIIPDGNTILKAGDLIRIFGKPIDVTNFLNKLGLNMGKIKDVVIIGAGKVTFYLTDILIKNNLKVKIIEKDEESCESISDAYPKSLVIRGDGTDEKILETENVKKSGAIICLTDRDEENVIIGLYAKKFHIPKIILKLNHINTNIVKDLDLGSVICPKNITSYQILKYVRGLKDSSKSSHIQTIYKILDTEENKVEVIEFDITSKSDIVGKPLKSLKIKSGVLIGCIIRYGNIIIPTGESSLRVKDSVLVIAKNHNIHEIDEILK